MTIAVDMAKHNSNVNNLLDELFTELPFRKNASALYETEPNVDEKGSCR